MIADDRLNIFVMASLLVHAAALAWVDVSGGAAVGRLPATLEVLIENRSAQSPSTPSPPPASARRNRDLFDRPPALAELARFHAPEVEAFDAADLRPAARPLPEPLQTVAAESAADPGGAADRGELLALLHQAISRHKRYPSMALRQRREGTATVSFNLSPSGEMDAIGVDRSSGFGPLDDAAVAAVSRVAPFGPATTYLSDVTRFTVDVTFRLN